MDSFHMECVLKQAYSYFPLNKKQTIQNFHYYKFFILQCPQIEIAFPSNFISQLYININICLLYNLQKIIHEKATSQKYCHLKTSLYKQLIRLSIFIYQQSQKNLSNTLSNQQTQQIKLISGSPERESQEFFMTNVNNIQTKDIKYIKHQVKYEDIQKIKAKKFIQRIRQQKEQFFGKLFLIKKKEEQDLKLKYEQIQKENQRKKQRDKLQRAKRAFQNAAMHRNKTQHRNQFKFKKSHKIEQNSSEKKINQKLELPIIVDKSSPKRFGYTDNEKGSRVLINGGQQVKIKGVSKDYIEEQKRKCYQRLKKLQQLECLKQKQIQEQFYSKINELNRDRFDETKQGNNRFMNNNNQLNIQNQYSKPVKQKYFMNNNSQKKQNRTNLQTRYNNHELSLKEPSISKEVLYRSQTAEASIQAKDELDNKYMSKIKNKMDIFQKMMNQRLKIDGQDFK